MELQIIVNTSFAEKDNNSNILLTVIDTFNSSTPLLEAAENVQKVGHDSLGCSIYRVSEMDVERISFGDLYSPSRWIVSLYLYDKKIVVETTN